MATLVNLTTQRPDDGKEVTKSLSHINPNATDKNVGNFVVALNSLSKNSIVNVEKVVKSDIDVTGANDSEEEGD